MLWVENKDYYHNYYYDNSPCKFGCSNSPCKFGYGNSQANLAVMIPHPNLVMPIPHVQIWLANISICTQYYYIM